MPSLFFLQEPKKYNSENIINIIFKYITKDSNDSSITLKIPTSYQISESSQLMAISTLKV